MSRREVAIMLIGVDVQRHQHLTHVALADGLPRPRSRLAECWQEQADQQRHDGDHHQEFDQSETTIGTLYPMTLSFSIPNIPLKL